MKMTFSQWITTLLLITISAHTNLYADAYDSSASVLRFQKQMAKRGNAESQFKLGLMYETGSGIKKSPVLASSWYKKAAEQNYKPASNRLTYLEIKKSGFNESNKEWLKKLKNDARFHEGEALFLLGQMYSEGTGVNKSLTRSLELLHKAAGGNIPGSDAEIARVEHELALLQKHYLVEKNKITPVILPVKKTPKSSPGPASSITTGSIKKRPLPVVNKLKKTPVKRQPTLKKAAQKRPEPKNKQLIMTSIKPKSVNKIKAPKPIEKEEQHPMDRICGGRNRFSRACR